MHSCLGTSNTNNIAPWVHGADTFDCQFAKRSEALKPYDESQGDLFNEVECEAAKEEEVEVTTTTTTKKRGKRKPLPKTLPREVIELDLDDHEKQCSC